jgi:hypothetical protein
VTKKKLLLVAAALVVLGAVLMALPRFGEPDLVCVSEGEPSSGFADADQGDCPVSIESYNEYAEWNSGPVWTRIGGLVLVVGGLGVGVTALVRGRGSRTAPEPSQESSTGT